MSELCTRTRRSTEQTTKILLLVYTIQVSYLFFGSIHPIKIQSTCELWDSLPSRRKMEVTDDESLTPEEWVEWEEVGWHPPYTFAGNGGLRLIDDYPDKMPVWVRSDAKSMWPLPGNIPATFKLLEADPNETVDRSTKVGPEAAIEQLARRTMNEMPINKWVEKRILHTADGLKLPRLAPKYLGYEHMDIRWHVRAGDGLVLVLTGDRHWEPRVDLVAEAKGERPPPPLTRHTMSVTVA